MRILHSSDLHGRYKPLLQLDDPFDVWVDTGDFFPNRGRVPATGYAILPGPERAYQMRWLGFKKLPSRLAAWLDGRPALVMPGNHDFVSLAVVLRAARVDVAQVSPEGVTHAGMTWAGFREIPAMSGEWPGETDAFAPLIEVVVGADPDVLVTHAPAQGILDGTDDYGIPGLAAAMARMPKLRAHLFGHEHHDGGKHARVGAVDCYNGAQTVRLIEI